MDKTPSGDLDTTRKRGRPAATAREDLKNALLDAAEELFAGQGYAATSLREVADRAGGNPALVHYYFDNKLGLLKAVLDRALEPMAGALAAMREEQEPDIGQIAQLMFSMASRHPALPRLIVREVLLSGGAMQKLFVEHYAPRLGGALPQLVQRAQQQGRIDPGLDPGITALMVLSLCMFPFVARSIAEAKLGIRYDEAGRAEYLRHLAQLFNRGIES